MIFDYQPFDVKSPLYISEQEIAKIEYPDDPAIIAKFYVEEKQVAKIEVPNDPTVIAQAIVEGGHNYGDYQVKVLAPRWFFDELNSHVGKLETQQYNMNKIVLERAE